MRGLYLELAEELSLLVGKMNLGEEKWMTLLNQAILFASDEVVEEIFRFNKVFGDKADKERGTSKVQMTGDDIAPLFEAIRADMGLKSSAIRRHGLIFFQKR